MNFTLPNARKGLVRVQILQFWEYQLVPAVVIFIFSYKDMFTGVCTAADYSLTLASVSSTIFATPFILSSNKMIKLKSTTY